LEINSIETSIQDESNSSKLLDVWEDANLLEFLKTGIHLPGLSHPNPYLKIKFLCVISKI
jgi:hypothetical protein